ncbi:sodium:calcium symporter [Kiritimatiellota bacterium B12222]|nr:sodium:calcium symporter [Kiritimatiellota bacterium B12222]
MDFFHHAISSLGNAAPYAALFLFILANFLVIWRLESLAAKGVEGTVLGTIFMPFCSGMGNIIFALVLARHGGAGSDVLINCLFNNITNLTLLIAAPALIWKMSGLSSKKGKAAQQAYHIGRLSLSLNLVAVLFFTLITWLLSADGSLSRMDGFVFLALFIFWLCFHLYDVQKTNLLQKKRYPKSLPLEAFLLLLCAATVVVSTDWLVEWFQQQDHSWAPQHLLGWLSGVLMVLPNALLAFYYGAKNRMDVVYTSQAGDAHICIPLCIGLFAIFSPIPSSPFLQQSMLGLMALAGIHLFFVTCGGRLPRPVAAVLIMAFAAFIYLGLA